MSRIAALKLAVQEAIEEDIIVRNQATVLAKSAKPGPSKSVKIWNGSMISHCVLVKRQSPPIGTARILPAHGYLRTHRETGHKIFLAIQTPTVASIIPEHMGVFVRPRLLETLGSSGQVNSAVLVGLVASLPAGLALEHPIGSEVPILETFSPITSKMSGRLRIVVPTVRSHLFVQII